MGGRFVVSGEGRRVDNGAVNSLPPPAAQWSGSNAFRLMPDDELAERRSSATSTMHTGGKSWTLEYDWVHPADGTQSGILLIGSAGDDGQVTVAWTDSWHQQPTLGVLLGRFVDGTIAVEMDYAPGWSWRIALRLGDDELRMVMHNVMPDLPDGYVVMDAAWSREA